jgi:hypothetical protein
METMQRIISTFACAFAMLIWTCVPVPVMEARGASNVKSADRQPHFTLRGAAGAIGSEVNPPDRGLDCGQKQTTTSRK